MRYIEKNEKVIRSSVAPSSCAKMVNVVRNKASQDGISLSILDTKHREEKYPFGHKDD